MKLLKLTLSALLCLLLTGGVSAQGTPVPATDDSPATMPDDEMMMAKTNNAKSNIEFGLTPGYMWTASDVDAGGGYGVGVHFRKSLDHIFSLRLDGLYGQASGDDENSSGNSFDNNWISGSLNGVMTLNNFRPDGDLRKTNIYALAGAGANFFEVEQESNRPNTDPSVVIEREFSAHANVGAGISFRVSRRFNVGVEYRAMVPFGNRADLLDGKAEGNFRDVQNFAGLNLNFNIGKGAEPRYWQNAFAPLREEIGEVSGRIDAATRDSDGDGVVDAIDQEANTPAGAPVDTKGKTLDSDGDGVPDYRDLEPFFPPRAGEEVDDNGMVLNRNDKPITEDRVQEMIDASIARLQATQNAGTTQVMTDRGEIYLPMIYFALNKSSIRFADYGTLSSVARVMQGNPGMKLVVRGYTDRTGNAANNQVLSYRRAQSVVDHLVEQHGISRSRLILQYRGEENAIVPRDQSFVNRRVEFLTAEPGATSDPAPAGAGSGRGY